LTATNGLANNRERPRICSRSLWRSVDRRAVPCILFGLGDVFWSGGGASPARCRPAVRSRGENTEYEASVAADKATSESAPQGDLGKVIALLIVWP
jgi:hypothetical protein